MAEDKRQTSPGAQGVVEDLDPAPTALELAEAAALRDELERPVATSSQLASLGLALRAANAPKDLDAAAHAALIDAAVRNFKPKPQRSNVIRVAFGGTVASVLAVAAGMVLVLQQSTPDQVATAKVELAAARSTEPLFAEPFQPGQTSARIDRIAMARGQDYRENRFRRWGVR